MKHFALAWLNIAILLLASPSRAQTVEQFYRGRTVNIIVPFTAGGYYDLGARVVARHYGRFLPGNPAFVVQNQPGAAGVALGNRLANSIERDGGTIAAISRGMPQLAIAGDPNIAFDPVKLTWLGSLSSYGSDGYLLIVDAANPARTFDDLRRAARPVHLGANSVGSTNVTFALLARDMLGGKIEIVRGFPGARDIWLAMDRGEVEGQVVDVSAILVARPELWKAGKLRPLVQFGRATRLPDLPDVPTGRELVADRLDRALLEFSEMPFFMALPFAGPPGVPADRAAALRAGFLAMAADPDFLADIGRTGIITSPISGEAITEIIARGATTPPDVLKRFRVLTGEN